MKFFNFLVLLLFLSFSGVAQQKYPKKLIQFGWDYPTISYIKENIKRMETRPFDGVAFSFDFKIFDLFDTTLYEQEKFQFEDLKGIKWKNFTDNFIRVRAQSKSGANWLDDSAWEIILKNVKNISKAVMISGAKGIFFDPEYYYVNPKTDPWLYDSSFYKGLSYQQVGEKVKKRGYQFMQALQEYKQDPVILSLWMLSLVTLQSREVPIEQAGMALYPLFVEGMMTAKNPNSIIVDGNELGFSYRDEFQFVFSGEELRDWGVDMMPLELKKTYQDVPVAYPIFLDMILALNPVYSKGFTEVQKKNWLESNLYYAFKSSDKYVWFYNQKIDMWRNGNPEIESIIRQVKTKLINDFRTKANLSGSSSAMSFLERSSIGQTHFTYSYNVKRKKLKIHFLSEDISDFYIFENSRLFLHRLNPATDINLNLSNFSDSANLILVSKNKNGVYSFAYLN